MNTNPTNIITEVRENEIWISFYAGDDIAAAAVPNTPVWVQDAGDEGAELPLREALVYDDQAFVYEDVEEGLLEIKFSWDHSADRSQNQVFIDTREGRAVLPVKVLIEWVKDHGELDGHTEFLLEEV